MAAEVRRLSDSILAAFDHAMAQEDLEVAEHLFRALELVWTRPPPGRAPDRRNDEDDPVVPAFERLEALRQKLKSPSPTGDTGAAGDG